MDMDSVDDIYRDLPSDGSDSSRPPGEALERNETDVATEQGTQPPQDGDELHITSFVDPNSFEEAKRALNQWQEVLTAEFHRDPDLLMEVSPSWVVERRDGGGQEEPAAGAELDTAEISGTKPLVKSIHPTSIAEELRRAWSSERQLRAQAAMLRQRMAAALSEALVCMKEDVDLRRELQLSRAVSEPSVLQLRQLLLEPAVNAEFARVAAAAEAAKVEVGKLKHDMLMLYSAAANDPKGPRSAAAQIRKLEEECERLKEHASNSRAAALEKSLEMAKVQLEEMRKQYGELEDHAHSLDDEAELLQKEITMLRRDGTASTPRPPSRPRAPPPAPPGQYRAGHSGHPSMRPAMPQGIWRGGMPPPRAPMVIGRPGEGAPGGWRGGPPAPFGGKRPRGEY